MNWTVICLRDYLGEDAMNAALRNLIAEFQYQHQPYPTTRDLIRVLREQASDEHQVLITDIVYLQKHQISRGENTIVIELDERPTFAGIDPSLSLLVGM